MDGFKVICNKCGNEAILKTLEDETYKGVYPNLTIITSNETIDTSVSEGTGYYGIACHKCGNEAQGEY